MKNKIYLEKNRAIKVIAYLVFFTIFYSFMLFLRSSYEHINQDSLLFVFLIVFLIWFYLLHTVYKNRIEINHQFLYARYYLWYEGFIQDEAERPLYNSISWSQIESAQLIQVHSSIKKKMIFVIKIKVKNKYELCMLLDAFVDQKISEIMKHIQYNIQKPI